MGQSIERELLRERSSYPLPPVGASVLFDRDQVDWTEPSAHDVALGSRYRHVDVGGPRPFVELRPALVRALAIACPFEPQVLPAIKASYRSFAENRTYLAGTFRYVARFDIKHAYESVSIDLLRDSVPQEASSVNSPAYWRVLDLIERSFGYPLIRGYGVTRGHFDAAMEEVLPSRPSEGLLRWGDDWAFYSDSIERCREFIGEATGRAAAWGLEPNSVKTGVFPSAEERRLEVWHWSEAEALVVLRETLDDLALDERERWVRLKHAARLLSEGSTVVEGAWILGILESMGPAVGRLGPLVVRSLRAQMPDPELAAQIVAQVMGSSAWVNGWLLLYVARLGLREVFDLIAEAPVLPDLAHDALARWSALACGSTAFLRRLDDEIGESDYFNDVARIVGADVAPSLVEISTAL